ADTYTKTKQKTSLELYRELIQDFKPVNKKTTRKELRQLLKKYSYADYYYASNDYNAPNQSYYNIIEKRYNLHPVNNGLSNLVDKKYRWYSNNDSRFRVWLYVSFIVCLLLFIFRHTTVKTFFLSILTVIILFVITAVLLAFARGDAQIIFSICIAYYLLFLLTALAGKTNAIRSTFIGIATNIITFFTFLFPLFCTMVYYEGIEKQYRFTQNYPDGFNETKENYLLIAEVAGFILFLILLQPFFKRLYRSWFSKPEE
ncbi:MAG: hypothetical protein KA160_06780, partial [Lacibacter sp.]|nr:hypothetical protein [Lacibacter sp.]